MSKYCLSFLLIFLFINLQSQNFTNLRVVNPENWVSAKSTIEEAQFTIRPRGVYMEVGMYLTFSAKGATRYSNILQDTINLEEATDDLEAQLQFSLPYNSMVTDSWLWVNEDIIQADIEERWKATRTFQEIVGYRLDPSLLTKNNTDYYYDENGEDYYNIRIYPLQPDSTRRVKITYLAPGNWGNGKVSTALPAEILLKSRIPVEKTSILCYLENEFSNPRIEQLPNQNFSVATHQDLGNYYELHLDAAAIENGLEVSFDVPTKNGVFISNYSTPEKDYYQLVVQTEAVLLGGENPPKKVAVLIDYDTATTTIAKTAILETLKAQLIDKLNPQDFFSIILSDQYGVREVNGDWLQADLPTIDIIFNLLEEGYSLSDKSSLPELLSTGLKFIEDNNRGGEILLISPNVQFFEKNKAESFVDSLSAAFGGELPLIHIADFQNKNIEYDYFLYTNEENENQIFERRYYGNGYFYWLLRQATNGNLFDLASERNFSSLLSNSVAGLIAVDEVSEVKLSKENGSCFDEFIVSRKELNSRNPNFIKVGKCIGDFPFTLTISGKVDGELVTRNILIEEPNVNIGKEDHLTSWVGNYLLSLEQNRIFSGLTQRIINEAIKWSIDYRVLSLWTAFLALEEDLGGYVCEECMDETTPATITGNVITTTQNDSENEVELPNISFGDTRGGSPFIPPLGDSIITSTNDRIIEGAFQIEAKPNPFKYDTQIELSLKADLSTKNWSGAIFNLHGQKIKELPSFRVTVNGKYQFQWDGTNNQGAKLPAGIYLFVLQSENYQQSFKLVLMN